MASKLELDTMRPVSERANQGSRAVSRWGYKRLAVSKGWRVKASMALFVMLQSLPASAAPAIRLVVQAPCTGICPGPAFRVSVAQGEQFTVSVAAVDGSGMQDIAYVGTVQFSSTDPLASLPANYTFVPADQGFRAFPNGAALRTVGVQTVTVTDPVNNLIPGVLTLTVTGQAATEVPALGDPAKILLVLALALCGFWLLQLNR